MRIIRLESRAAGAFPRAACETADGRKGKERNDIAIVFSEGEGGGGTVGIGTNDIRVEM